MCNFWATVFWLNDWQSSPIWECPLPCPDRVKSGRVVSIFAKNLLVMNDRWHSLHYCQMCYGVWIFSMVSENNLLFTILDSVTNIYECNSLVKVDFTFILFSLKTNPNLCRPSAMLIHKIKRKSLLAHSFLARERALKVLFSVSPFPHYLQLKY